LVHAWNAFKLRDSYDLIVSDSEHSGIALALLFKLSGTRKRHVMITHWLTPPKKAFFFQQLQIQTHVDRIITYSTNQERVALDLLRLPRYKVKRVLHPADHRFWRPLGLGQEEMVCSAGLEFRDYPTLISAAEGLDVRIDIAAASPWSQRTNLAKMALLPPNVVISKRSYFELRELYDRSKFVVVPLLDVDFQAGSLVMYEAMAMGKAVIATRTQAHRDGDILREKETGLFVPPGDVSALREAILRLWSSPEEARRMGWNARRVVEAGLNHETYVRTMVEIVRQVACETAPVSSCGVTLAGQAHQTVLE
jgi:glycosyltransferase involved in cell wall biosynthesis